MSFFSSTDFASASANGTDWRDTSKNVLEQLENIKEGSHDFNFGFLYISDSLAEDAASIFNLFQSVLRIDDWVGSIGLGVIGYDRSYVDVSAISAMVCRFPEGSFSVFPARNEGNTQDSETVTAQDDIKKWLGSNTPMLTVVHGDPTAERDPRDRLRELEHVTNGFLVGGLTSSRSQHYQIANGVHHNEVSGVFFADSLPVSTTLSQGCKLISDYHTVTKASDSVILELDGTRALDAFQNDLCQVVSKKTKKIPEIFVSDLRSIKTSDHVPEEYKPLFEGQVHVALPFSQSDQKDFMVRHIINIDVDEGAISISENIGTGDRIAFVERNEETISSDLSARLVALRKRVQLERGCFEPKAALYISCIGRHFTDMPIDEQERGEDNEIQLIRDIIGDVPMTGFYAGGEINNARLYGYAGVLTLFF